MKTSFLSKMDRKILTLVPVRFAYFLTGQCTERVDQLLGKFGGGEVTREAGEIDRVPYSRLFNVRFGILLACGGTFLGGNETHFVAG